jgi:hypothetical protein
LNNWPSERRRHCTGSASNGLFLLLGASASGGQKASQRPTRGGVCTTRPMLAAPSFHWA